MLTIATCTLCIRLGKKKVNRGPCKIPNNEEFLGELEIPKHKAEALVSNFNIKRLVLLKDFFSFSVIDNVRVLKVCIELASTRTSHHGKKI